MKVLGEEGFGQTVDEIKKLRSKVSELQQIIDKSELGIGYIDCTYAEALELANNGELHAGYRYRINDYEPCVRESIFVKEVDKENKVKIYPFITALSKTEFDRNCTFQVETKHQGIIEVSGQYSFNNFIQSNGMDELLMTWVDPKNHKGVIVRIDSPIGKVPFDYYNIQLRNASNICWDRDAMNSILTTKYETYRGTIYKIDSKVYAGGILDRGKDFNRCFGEYTERYDLTRLTIGNLNEYQDSDYYHCIYISPDNQRTYAKKHLLKDVDLRPEQMVVGADLAENYIGKYLYQCDKGLQICNPNWTGSPIVSDTDNKWYFYIPDVTDNPTTITSLIKIWSNSKLKPNETNTKFTRNDQSISFHQPLNSDELIDVVNIKSISSSELLNWEYLVIYKDYKSYQFASITHGKDSIIYASHSDTDEYFWLYNEHMYHAQITEISYQSLIENSTEENLIQPGSVYLSLGITGQFGPVRPQTLTVNVLQKQSVITEVTPSTMTPNPFVRPESEKNYSTLNPALQPYGSDVCYADVLGGPQMMGESTAWWWAAKYNLYLPKSTVGYWPSYSTKLRNYVGLNLKDLTPYNPESNDTEVKLQNGKIVSVPGGHEYVIKLHEWLGSENVESLVLNFAYDGVELTDIRTPDTLFHANLPRNKQWNVIVSMSIPENGDYIYGYMANSDTQYFPLSAYSLERAKNMRAKLVLSITASNVDDPEDVYKFTSDIEFNIKFPDKD